MSTSVDRISGRMTDAPRIALIVSNEPELRSACNTRVSLKIGARIVIDDFELKLKGLNVNKAMMIQNYLI